MSTGQPKDITGLLEQIRCGDQQAMEQLVPLVYDELRRLAAEYMRRERTGHTLQPTALVHEAYLRLMEQRNPSWRNRAHFFGAAAGIMRRILVDHARGRAAAKRGAGAVTLSLEEAAEAGGPSEKRDVDMVALDQALDRLGELDAQQSRIVELRFFGGLSVREAAEVLHLSPATVKREWTVARAWLFRELAGGQGHEARHFS